MVDLHLLCLPGKQDIRYILDAARTCLAAQAEPTVAYLPAAAVGYDWLDYTEKAFAGLAALAYIGTETMPLDDIAAILDRAGLVYISGGNTFLLNHRLHRRGVFDLLRQKVLDGLPVVAFSAGTTLCGPNILTSNDINMCATTHFTALNLTPFNFSVHYPSEESARTETDAWLSGYHVYHGNPILALEDDAYLRVHDGEAVLVRGNGWLLEKGQPRQKVTPGRPIRP